MLYYRCVTCATELANKQLPWERGLEDICQNSKLTETEKDLRKKNLLTELEIINYCCRARVLTYVRKIDLIK